MPICLHLYLLVLINRYVQIIYKYACVNFKAIKYAHIGTYAVIFYQFKYLYIYTYIYIYLHIDIYVFHNPNVLYIYIHICKWKYHETQDTLASMSLRFWS